MQRSRAYVRESQKQEGGNQAIFPEREPPEVAEYSIRKTYGRLLDMVERRSRRTAAVRRCPSTTRSPTTGASDEDIDPFEEGRQKQVVGLIRTQFLKRFESSVARLRAVLRPPAAEAAGLGRGAQRDRRRQKDAAGTVEGRSSPKLTGYLRRSSRSSSGSEDGERLRKRTSSRRRCSSRRAARPGRVRRRRMMLDDFLDDWTRSSSSSKSCAGSSSPSTTTSCRSSSGCSRPTGPEGAEGASSSPSLRTRPATSSSELDEAGIEGVAQIDSSSKRDRGDVIRRFAPYYNGSSSADARREGRTEIRILISTDVLSEGLNLRTPPG